jgi:hypothetical protein
MLFKPPSLDHVRFTTAPSGHSVTYADGKDEHKLVPNKII